MRQLYYGDRQIIKRYLGEHLVYERTLSLEEKIALKTSADTYDFCFTSADSVLEERSYNPHLHFLDQTVEGPLSLSAFYDQTWFSPRRVEKKQTQSLNASDAMCDYFPGID